MATISVVCLLVLTLAKFSESFLSGSTCDYNYLTFNNATCQGSQKKIKCDKYKMVHIDYARFGRWDTKTCTSDSDKPGSLDCKSLCPGFNPGVTRENANQWCDLQNQCNLPARSHPFDDPCPSVFKYLQVCYSCGLFHTTTVCEQKDLTELSCKAYEDKVIKIKSTHWGRTDPTYCSDGVDPKFLQNTQCYSDPVLLDQAIKEECDGEVECAKRANLLLTKQDPCPGTFKWLTVRWECVDKKDVGKC